MRGSKEVRQGQRSSCGKEVTVLRKKETVETLRVADLEIVLTRKRMKLLRLSVYPPRGDVRMSAPHRARISEIREFVETKIDWIRATQQKMKEKGDQSAGFTWDNPILPCCGMSWSTPHGACSGVDEGCNALPRVMIWGERYSVVTGSERSGINHERREVWVPPVALKLLDSAGSPLVSAVDAIMRESVAQEVKRLVARWAPRMQVNPTRIYVRRMKSKWGSCNIVKRSIRLNTALIALPPECLEYVVVHELAHLIEPSHNRNFYRIMDEFMPEWRRISKGLPA